MLVISAALIVFLSTFLHLFLSPFTKVEESFNLHAIHDFIHQPSLSAVAHAGDHVQFPGPLPRTFIGALLLGSIARVSLPLFRFVGIVQSKFAEQIFVRALLAIFNSSSLVYFGLCTRFVFGDFLSVFMLLLSASQFHLAFYASRTLPNMFAFPFGSLIFLCIQSVDQHQIHPSSFFSSKINSAVQIALGQYMITMRRGKASSVRKLGTLNACSFLTFAAVVFRLELMGLLVPIVLLSLISKRVTFWQLVSRGFLVTFAGLGQ
jgi:alpha-1,6-mannosyltransferase